MGIATRQSLVRFAHGTPALACGGTGLHDNGNGSLMRILPLALYLHSVKGNSFPQNPQTYETIHHASALTHAHPISCIACGIYCSVANELLCGRCAPEDIQRGIAVAKGFYALSPELSPWLEEFQRIDIHTLLALHQKDIRASGYVVHTLEAALWCLLRTRSFSDCLLEAVNLGEDTDTVGAVVGGLAGIQYGLAGIPRPWLDILARRAEIEALCTTFDQSLS